MGAARGWSWLLRLSAYWFGLAVVWGALSTVVIPALVGARVPNELKGSAVALVAAVQALVAIVVQPMSGALSDRLTTRWGRRRPWMVVGVALQAVAVLALAVVPGYWPIVLLMAGVELASNAAQGPYQALLPDLLPAGRRGAASGVLGAATLGGQIIGAAMAGVAVAAGATSLAVWIAAVTVAAGMLVTVLGVGEPAEAGAAAAPTPWRAAARQTLAGIWGRDLLERRSFLWLIASRLAVLMATGTLQPFILYYLSDSIGLGDRAGPAVAPIAAVVAFSAALVAIPAGVATTRFGRVRVVASGCAVGAVGALLFAVAPGYVALFFIAIPFGVALGSFLSADWALLVDVVPADQAGRFLGLANTVTSAGALLAVVIAGPVADLVNGWQAGLGYRAIFVLAAVEFAIGAWCVLRVVEPSRASRPTGVPLSP
jgi:MFS family permease